MPARGESLLFNVADFLSFKLAICFRKCRSRFHLWMKVNYSALTTTNHLALPSQFVVLRGKITCLSEIVIHTKIHA